MIRRAPSVGPCVKERHRLYEKEKASSNSGKCTIQRMALKGTDTFFVVKEYLHNKFQRQKIL
jgi:hypothetical protein